MATVEYEIRFVEDQDENSDEDHWEDTYTIFQSGLGADALVVCGDQSWPVHSSLLCAQSLWFQKAFNGPFEVRRSKPKLVIPRV